MTPNDTFESFWELNHRSLPVEDPKALAKALYGRFLANELALSHDAESRAIQQARSISDDNDALIAELEKVAKERDELAGWKREKLLVESGWDAQKVADALSLPLGKSIRANILPAVIALRAENARLREELSRFTELPRVEDRTALTPTEQPASQETPDKSEDGRLLEIERAYMEGWADGFGVADTDSGDCVKDWKKSESRSAIRAAIEQEGAR